MPDEANKPDGANAGGEKPPEAKGGAGDGSSAKPVPPAPPEKKLDEKKPPEAKADDKGGKGGDAPKKDPTTLGEDDDDIPADVELVQMSKQALTKRLARHTKKELRDRFGTDDPDKIKADLEELKTLRQEKEDRRLAALSEVERAKEEAKKEKAKREEAEAVLQQERDARQYAEYDREAEGALGEVIAKKHLKRATRELKEYIAGLEDDDPILKKPRAAFDKWAKDFAKDNPEFAKEAPPEPKKVGLQTKGSPNAKTEKGDSDLATKTPTPGKPNSMTKTEYAQYKREKGLS